MEYISHNENETFSLAEKIAKKSRATDVFALCGDLGSGKTTFARAFAGALGVEAPVTSPTFVLIKTYKLKDNHDGAATLVHVDAYRLQESSDAESIGLIELTQRPDTITLIEWPERIKEVLPAKTKYIFFEYVDDKTRKINFDFED